MREVGEGAAAGRAAFAEGGLRDEQGRHDAAREQEQAHDRGRRREQPAPVADAAGRVPGVIGGVATHQRHDQDAGLEAGEAQGKLGEEDDGEAEHRERAAVGMGEQALPGDDRVRMTHDLGQSGADDHEIEREIGADERDGDADGLAEAFEEDRAEQGDQEQRHDDLVAMEGLRERVLADVRGGVGGREGDGDDETRGHEAEQAEHEEFALPPGQQALEHRDRAIAVGYLPGHPAVHGQCAAECDQHEDEGGEGGEQARGEGGDAGRVAERGQIVDTGQAHHAPPRMLVARIVSRCGLRGEQDRGQGRPRPT